VFIYRFFIYVGLFFVWVGFCLFGLFVFLLGCGVFRFLFDCGSIVFGVFIYDGYLAELMQSDKDRVQIGQINVNEAKEE
jgi:hypothetical protein